MSAHQLQMELALEELWKRGRLPTTDMNHPMNFGEQSATPWAQEKLYQLINHRYNAALATVITTCLSLEDLENRISSRMVDPTISLVFNILAPHYKSDMRPSRKPKLRQHIAKQ